MDIEYTLKKENSNFLDFGRPLDAYLIFLDKIWWKKCDNLSVFFSPHEFAVWKFPRIFSSTKFHEFALNWIFTNLLDMSMLYCLFAVHEKMFFMHKMFEFNALCMLRTLFYCLNARIWISQWCKIMRHTRRRLDDVFCLRLKNVCRASHKNTKLIILLSIILPKISLYFHFIFTEI